MSVRHIHEGFKNQRLTILPQQVVSRLSANPVTRQLYPTRAGFFPTASGHMIDRTEPLEEHLLITCLSGRGYSCTGNTRFHLDAGQVALLPAGLPHQYEADHAHPWSICWIHFSGQLAAEYFAFLGLSADSPVLSLKHPEHARDAFEQLYNRMQNLYDDTVLLQLHTQLAHYLSTLARGRRESEPSRLEQTERVERVIHYLSQNVDQKISVEAMAAIAHWSPNHFNTSFRRVVHESPAAFFLHMKMAHACERLRTTDATIAEIAASVGLEDAFYFSRCFKRCYRMTPTEYRKSIAR